VTTVRQTVDPCDGDVHIPGDIRNVEAEASTRQTVSDVGSVERFGRRK